MSLVINAKEISLDADGRYSLNDLHKSAGGDIKDLPNKFMRSESFKNVVNVLTAQNRAFKPVIKKTGRYTGGTWVCKELVYKYAMWVSAEFEVKVIQTFDALMSFKDSPLTMESLNELTAKIESDKEVASFCGKELARYKKIKADNELRFNNAVKDVQLVLGFK
jgi:hypothetical protein